MNIKTILIPIFQGVEARNILRTDIFKKLKAQNGVKLILLFFNEAKNNYFKQYFFGENILTEVAREYIPPRLNGFFSFWKFLLIRTKMMDTRRRVKLIDDHNYFNYVFKFLLNRIFARRFFRRVWRFLDWCLIKDDNFNRLFEKHQIDLVFLAHIFGDEETAILRQAQKRGIKSVGIINSWDKLTSRWAIRLLPDKLIVHNEIMEKEAIDLADMLPADIEITGIPHYDVYINSKPSSRADFFTKIGADINKRLLLFCPLGKTYSDVDIEILNLITTLQFKKEIPSDIQILVRFPPNDIIDMNHISNKELLIIDRPGKRFSSGIDRRVDWDMDEEEIQHLLDTLYYSSLLVCHISTMAIDASVFDKPVVNFKIDSLGIGRGTRSANWIYQSDHYAPIIKSGGVHIAESPEELKKWINKYLAEPWLDQAGRQKIVQEQCWKLDGQAGRRVAEFIIKFLYQDAI